MENIFKFLSALAKNNNKEWFDAHKSDYQKAKTDFINVVDDVIKASSKFDPALAGIEASKAIFRINRDVRFSKDKSPYKTNFGASINPGGKKSMIAGYYMHIEPGKCFLAAGSYMPMPDQLAAFRQEIDYNLADFKKILSAAAFKKEFGGLSKEDELKTVPKGYDKENPALEYLKQKHFIVVKDLSDKEVKAASFSKNAAATFKAAHPFNTFLRKASE